MFRNILAVVVGVIIGGLVKAGLDLVNRSQFPPPKDLVPGDFRGLEAFISELPLTSFLLMLIAQFVGTMVACLIAAKFSSSNKFYIGILAGIIMSVAGVTALFMIPYPTWYIIALPISTMFAVLLGSRIGSRSETIIDY